DLKLLSAFADDGATSHPQIVRIGEGLVGQCAADRRSMLINELPPNVIPIGSASFKVPPRNVIVLPVLFESQVKAVIELGSIGTFTALQIPFLEQLTAPIRLLPNRITPTIHPPPLPNHP